MPAGTVLSFSSWQQVWDHRDRLHRSGPFFLELFAGKAGLTEAVRQHHVQALPPMDIVLFPLVQDPQDVIDTTFWQQCAQILRSGAVLFLYYSIPCNTFTSARKDNGGPPPLRSLDLPMGLEDLSWDNECLVFLGNLFLFDYVRLV